MEKESVGKRSPWLAISMGCCASEREEVEMDEGREALRANGETEMKICYDQPQTVSPPRAEPSSPRPTTAHSMGRHVSQWVATSRDFASRASSRASVYTLTRPRKSHSKVRRLSISGPTDFRHDNGYDGADGVQSMLDDAAMPVRRRRSFRPLELSIYLPEGRLSPLPDFELDDWSEMPQLPPLALVRNRDSRTNSVASDPSTTSYLVQRKPVGSAAGSRRSSVQSVRSVGSRPLSGTLSTLPFLQEEPKVSAESIRCSRTLSTLPFLQETPRLRAESIRSSTTTTSELQRRGTLSPPRILSRLPSPSRARSSTAPSRPASLRRAKTDVDEAIRELNTIVEERRADAYRSRNLSPAFTNRPPPSPSSHVPAIAPSLRMHVRSETLSDIGSAFSVPLASKPLPPPPPVPGSASRRTTRLTLAPPSGTFSTFSGPLDSNPITPPTPTVPTPTTPIHRLGAWLKRSLPSTPSTPFTSTTASASAPKSAPTPRKSFYQCASEPAIPSRPSTASTITPAHTRHPSAESATVTLISCPSLSASSTPHHTPTSSQHSLKTLSTSPSPPSSPPRALPLKGPGKPRRVPAPLILSREKEIAVDAGLGSARSSVSVGGTRRPPPSPNYGILRGMEIGARLEGVSQHLGMGGAAVGVAF